MELIITSVPVPTKIEFIQDNIHNEITIRKFFSSDDKNSFTIKLLYKNNLTNEIITNVSVEVLVEPSMATNCLQHLSNGTLSAYIRS